MTAPLLHPLDQINAEWEVLRSSPSSRAAMSALERAEPAVAALGAVDLGELVGSTRAPRVAADMPAGQPGAIVRMLLRSHDCHPLVPRATLQALLPGLVGVARRLSWGSGGDWESAGAFFVDLLATTWEVVVAWGGADRPYAAGDILSAVRCRVRRQILHHRAERSRVVPASQWEGPGQLGEPIPWRPGGDLLDGGAHGGLPTGGLERLAREIDDLAGRGLDPADAAVAYVHHVLGLSIAEISQMTGRSRRHLDARCRRAERRLCA